MKRYLITGQVGSGKSSIGRCLAERGYQVIDIDAAGDLVGWIRKDSGLPVAESPPYPLSEAWLIQHVWAWNGERLRRLIADPAHTLIFFCGAAHNRKDFAALFDRTFYLILDRDTLKQRLQQREPLRWPDDSVELLSQLEWNDERGDFDDRVETPIDGARPLTAVAEDILNHLPAELMRPRMGRAC